jgi:hypothetical protein
MIGSFARGIGQEPAIDELLEKWKQAPNNQERESIEQNLRDALQAEFQARLTAHEKEVDQLESEVKRLRQQLELRRQKQADIVRFHLEQLLREAQGLGWGTEPVQSSHTGRPRVTDVPSAFAPAMPHARLSGIYDTNNAATANELAPRPQSADEPVAPVAPGSAAGRPVETTPLRNSRPANDAPSIGLPAGPAPETPKPDQPGAGTPNPKRS